MESLNATEYGFPETVDNRFLPFYFMKQTLPPTPSLLNLIPFLVAMLSFLYRYRHTLRYKTHLTSTKPAPRIPYETLLLCTCSIYWLGRTISAIIQALYMYAD